METELEMFVRVADASISIDQVSINRAGVAFVIEGDRGREIRRMSVTWTAAVRVREGWSKLSVVGTACGTPRASCNTWLEALSRVNVEIIHCTDSNVTISILVPAAERRAPRSPSTSSWFGSGG